MASHSTSGRDLVIPATRSTPEVRCEWQAGMIFMLGESYPENPNEIFGALISWVEDYLAMTQGPLSLDLCLGYLNTSSVRAMIEIFDKLQSAFDSGRIVTVAWLYDIRNPRAAEMGDEFKEDYSFNFSIAILKPDS